MVNTSFIGLHATSVLEIPQTSVGRHEDGIIIHGVLLLFGHLEQSLRVLGRADSEIFYVFADM